MPFFMLYSKPAYLLPEARLRTIVAQGGGNPFFLEELAWHAVEQGGRDTLGAVPETVHAVIGRQSCFQCYCTHLTGSCQGKQEHAPADDEYARRSIRCFLTYLRIRRCACVRQRILRVCRCIGSL
jgi:hypothetical protein